MTDIKAKVVPFSSVVGSSVMLHEAKTGRVVGQLGVMLTGGELVWTTQMMRVWHDADGWHEEPVTAETED